MSKIKTVVLANPVGAQDPLFLKDGGGYLFPRVVARLKNAGLVHDCVVSLPETVDSGLKGLLADWRIPCVYSTRQLPQHRLDALAGSSEAEAFLLLTPYAYLLEQEVLSAAIGSFFSSDEHCLSYGGTSASSHFVLCDKVAIRSMANTEGFAVTPFVAAHYVRQSLGQASVREVSHPDHFKARSFLLKMLYHGDTGLLPVTFLENYFESTPEQKLFSLDSYCSHLASWFEISNFENFSEGLEPLLTEEDLSTFAAQFHFVERVLPFMPSKRNLFLELGFGRSPIASMLMLNYFQAGIAVEPYAKHALKCALLEFLSKNIRPPQGVDFSLFRDCPNVLRNLRLCRNKVQNCDIPLGSVDFVFSKTVFEHVMDVEEVSLYLYCLLSSKGRMYHIIDHKDHVDTSSIRFDFLKHDKPSWASLKAGTNLWRVNDFVALWERIGFKVEVVERFSRVLPIKDLHECWRNYSNDDLYCYNSTIIAEKPA